MKKLLTLLGSVSMIGTAGATVVACGNTKTEEAKATPKEQLTKGITEAQAALKAGTKKSKAAKETLQAAIDAAQTILNDKNSTDEQLKEALTTLQAAVTTFNNSANEEENTELNTVELLQIIREATQALADQDKVESAEKTLLEAIIKAEDALATAKDQIIIDNATSTLKTALEAFKSADEEGVDNGWFILQEKIANLEFKLGNLVNLAENDEPVLTANRILEAIKEIPAHAEKSEIDRAIYNCERALQHLTEKDKTDFTSYEEAKTRYDHVSKALINKPKEGLKEQIEALIKTDDEIINNNDKILTKEVKAMAAEINNLVNELENFDHDSREEQALMKTLNKEIVNLQTKIQGAWESNGDDEILHSLKVQIDNLAKESSDYLEEIMADKNPIKDKIRKAIDDYRSDYDKINETFTNHQNGNELGDYLA